MAPLRTGGFYGLWNGRRADELKTIDSTATTDIPTAGLVNTISGVAAGTDYNNRIGRKIMMKSLLFRFALSPIATASAPSTMTGIWGWFIAWMPYLILLGFILIGVLWPIFSG